MLTDKSRKCIKAEMSQSEILYVHAKRSMRVDPGHWLFDTGTRTAVGSLSPSSSGWKVNLFDGHKHPILKSVEEVCAYVSSHKGKPVRPASVRELRLPEEL